MPIVSNLTLFATFIFIALVGLYLFVTSYNKRSRKVIDKFIEQASSLKPTVFQNIKLRYTETNGLKIYIYPNNHCDLYLFDNCISIVRRQDFIFKVFFAPVMLTSDIAISKNIFNFLETYTPNQITFKQMVIGEVDITLTESANKHYTKDITLKGLTKEQTTQLEIIKNWYSQI